MSGRDTDRPVRPRIARIWTGRTRPDRADAYQRYLLEAGVPPLVATALGVEVFREDGVEATTFMTVSWWESVAAMARFAGADPRRVHHLPRDAELLLALPPAVRVLDIVARHGAAIPPGSHAIVI